MEENKGLSADKPRLMLIDAWNIMIAQNSVANILDSNTMQVGMYLSTCNMIRTFVDKFKPNKIIFAMDGPQAGERRRKLYSGYKAGRRVKAKTSSIILKEGEEEDDYTKYTSQGSFTFQMERIFNFLKTLPVSIVIVPYCEGDDLIAYLALKNKEQYECIIVSGDKDYCQLIQPGINVYNWREKLFYDEAKFREIFKILPQNYIFMKVLLGDSSDEVKGVKGIGKKTFPYFEEMLSAKVYDNVGEFVEATKEMNLDAVDTRSRNAIKNIWLEDAVENMFLLYQVMKLDENCLKLHHIETLRQQIEEQEIKVFSRMSATIMATKHTFNKLYNGFNIDKWLQPFVFVKTTLKTKL